MTTTKKPAVWVATVGIDAAGKRYNPGDPVPATLAKTKWLVEQGHIVKAGK